MKSLIEILVKALVDSPDSVEVSEINEGPSSVTYEVTVDPDDLGKVIGKQGRVANALRTVAKAAALKSHKNVYVKILP
ncbi:MAG: KH domain-containing protein [Armatimonadota bacterium]|nr:KH domain-containing protein [bacterium]